MNAAGLDVTEEQLAAINTATDEDIAHLRDLARSYYIDHPEKVDELMAKVDNTTGAYVKIMSGLLYYSPKLDDADSDDPRLRQEAAEARAILTNLRDTLRSRPDWKVDPRAEFHATEDPKLSDEVKTSGRCGIAAARRSLRTSEPTP